ncbi:hypothetical protein, partial [Streptococcus pneumoniae]|uniref:hypothetical protein n=1 Tax=Streptococcus pneumoniae TaxID=1313 RepID=UPI001939C25B
EYQKRKDKICPFSSLAFFQPTTVDKEPKICPFSSLAFLQPTTVDKEPLKIALKIISPVRKIG